MREDKAREKIERVRSQPKKYLYGIDHAIDVAILGLFTSVPYTSPQGKKELGQAHMIWFDVPGVGKTDLIRTLSFAIGASSQFIAGHPEMMPREIMGGEIYIQKEGRFILRKGPIFSHIINFDEINRTHPRSQAPFLQAMEERVAILETTDLEAGRLRKEMFRLTPITDNLDEARHFFWVLATGNPIEQEGTYALPEAQLDRFTFSSSIGYPPREEEKKIRTGNVLHDREGKRLEIEKVIDLPEVLEISDLILKTVASPGDICRKGANKIDEYMMRLIENSRPHTASRNSATKRLKEYVDEYVAVGMSPRSNFHFEAGCRTQAFLSGRNYISADDVKYIAPLVMSHRLTLSPRAKGTNVSAKDVVREILNDTEAP